MGKKSANKKLADNKFPVYSEQGAVTQKRSAAVNVALVYPNTYQAGMSNLGFQSVYGLFNAHDHVACHRFFLSEHTRERRSRELRSRELRSRELRGRELRKREPGANEKSRRLLNENHAHLSCNSNTSPASVETGMPLSAYDIIAFSVSFENDYLHLISILKDAGIPLRSSNRDASHPLIIAGGVACFLNPEPAAPFIDCFLMGESEGIIANFITIFTSNSVTAVSSAVSSDLSSDLSSAVSSDLSSDLSSDRTGKRSLLKQLASTVKGVYVPAFYAPEYSFESGEKKFSGWQSLYHDIPRRIAVQHIPDLSTIATTTRILTSDTAFNNTFLIETGRGCPHGCRFCSAGFIYRPPRFYPDHVIINAMNKIYSNTDNKIYTNINKTRMMTDRIGLVGAAVSDHPGINEICAAGIANGQKISFSSLRLDNLTDETIQTLVNASVKTATIAPEAGSERMRRIINKKITEPQILSAVQRIVAHGIINIKLYFMTGLPFETEEDVRQIVQLTKKIKETFLEASRKNRKIGTITLSINPFIPKPSTPFQWAAMDTPATFKKKIKIIREGLKRVGNITINTESPRMAAVNALLSRGDRRMAELLETAMEKGWSQAIKHSEFKSLVYHTLEMSAPLPWDILDTGIKKEFLMKEFQRAEREKISPDCPLVKCSLCGICSQ